MPQRRATGVFTITTVIDGQDAQYIYLRGTAHDQSNDVNTQLSPEVRINGGNNVATNKRGLNLVTINRQTLALVEAINYDTYGEAKGESGKTGITDLKAKLNGLNDDVFVCLVSCDAIGWDADLITILHGFGMSDLTWSGARRSPFLFIGYKGLGKGNGLTRMRDVGPYTDFVEISVYIANGTFGTRDGSASIIASMNNQNDSISCNESGYPVRQQTVSTVLSLYVGTDLKTFTPTVKRNGTAMTIGTASNGVTVNYNTNTRTLSVTYATSARIQNGKDLYEITLTADSIIRTLIFTVGGVIGDVYNLKPSVDEIVAQKDDDGYTVGGSATYFLKCGYTKNVEGVLTTVDDAGALGVVDQYYLFYRRRSRITGNWETWDGTKTVWDNSGTPMYNRYHNASSEDPSYNRSSINVNDIDAIEFFLTEEGATHLTGYATNNLTFIDSQFVPVINNGAAGHNTAKVLLYKRQMGSDDAPTTGPGIQLYYKFSTKKLYTDAACTTEYTDQTPSGGGWSMQNPGQEIYKKVYVTSATAYSQEDVDTIASGEWATPVVDNDNVLATTVTIYKRSKEEPTDKPANGAVYTFASGVLTGTLNGWSTAFPADNGYPCWRRHATALGSNQTDVINASEWSTPAVKVVEDGKNGLNAVSLKNFTSQWLCNNASSPAPDASSSSWGNSYIEPTDSNRFTWRKDVYEYDAPESGRNILKGTSTPKTVENMVMSDNDGTKDFYGFSAYFMRAAWNELGLSEGDYMTISLDWSVTNAPAGAKFRLENGAAPWAPYGVTINLEAGSSNGHIEKTFQVTQALAESTGSILRFRFDDATGMNFTVSKAKLEHGDEATDWCQAPEDLNHTDIYICSVYGENAIHLDLDNPHEDFLYDDAGNRKSEEAKSVIRLYNGIQQVTSGISYTIVTESDKTYGVVTNDSTSPYYAYVSNGVLTVKGINANSAKVTVQAKYNRNNYYASFTANKKRQDKYDLVIAPNALSYNKSVAWTDKTIAIKANRLSINGDFSKEIALKSNNLYVSALFDKEIKAFVLRNGANNNEAYWANETPIGTNNGEWSNTSSIRGNCKTGDYFLVYGSSSDASAKYYCLIKKCTNDSGNLVGECVATIVTNGNTATITIGEKIAEENNNILVELRKSSSYNPSDASTYSVEDYDTIPINKLENGANLGENLVDGNLTPFVVDKNSSSNYDSSTRWFSGVPFKLNNDIPDNTPLSCQMRIKFEGCSNINERDVKLWLSNTTIAKYPTIVVVNTNENGTFDVKQENFTVDSRNTQGVHTGWGTNLAFGWKRYYNGASTDIDFGTNGKITIDKVKLEIGTKCTAWCLSENDKKGNNGQSSFKSFVFCRSNNTPDTPSNAAQTGYNTYNSPLPPPVSGQPTWTDGAPDGEEMLWMSSRIFTSDGQSPQQSAWSTPRHMTDTADFDVEYSSLENPDLPYNHPNENTQWSNTASESTIWMATSEFHNGEWSNWNKIKIKGETGPASTEPGPAGGNTATIYLYKRGTSVDDVWGTYAKRPQMALYYSFADRKLYITETGTTSPSSSQLGGWSETIPEGSDPLYVTVAIAFANTARDVINNGEWVDPSRMVENGSQGVHGFNSATVFLYQRAKSDTAITNSDRPTGTFNYTFATGVLAPNTGADIKGWSQIIPTSNGYPCYVIQAAALSQEDTDNDVHEWSDVVKLVENGAPGNDSTVHWLVPTPSSVNFKSNTVGDFSGSATVECKVWKKVGDNAETEVAASSGKYDGFYLYYKIHRMTGEDNPTSGNSKTITWQEAVYGAVVSGGTNTNPVSSIEFILSTSSTGSGVAASNTIASASCPVTTDGRRGAVGATGKMFYSMGPWDDTYASYSRSGDLVPLVYYDGAYWYVKDSVTGNVPTGSAPSTSSQYWQKAEQYGVVITEGIFADFAKLGKAIVSGDYEFSMNGYIGDTQYVSGALWKGVPAYTLFCGDPSEEAFSYSGTKNLSTTFVSLNDNYVTISKDETMFFVLKVGSLTYRTQISIFTRNPVGSAQYFKYSTSATDNTWTATNLLELSADTTYYISFTATTTEGYFIKAKTVSGYGTMQFELTRLLFEPNWWVDLLTGKMSAAKGNFVVDPNGDVHINSGDVDISGTIRAKNLYHNVFVFMEGTYRSSADAKSGDADIILMVPEADNWNTEYDYLKTVLLPNPANYPGKLIEISILYYGHSSSAGDAIIGCEASTRFFSALQLYNDGGSIKNHDASSDVLARSSGTILKLVSMYVNTQYENKYYWVLISEMDATGGYYGTQTIGTKTIKVSNGLVKEIS